MSKPKDKEEKERRAILAAIIKDFRKRVRK